MRNPTTLLKCYRSIFLLFILFIGFSHCILAEELFIVKAKKPMTTIVIPQNASFSERFSANELIQYIQKMSSAQLHLVQEPIAPKTMSPFIYIGQTAASGKAGLTFKSGEHDDAFYIKTIEKKLFIKGKSDRATLFAVYAFLEELGVRWIMPSSMGEVIPQTSHIRFSSYNQYQKPGIDYRRFILLTTPKKLVGENTKWLARLRFNSMIRGKTKKNMGGDLAQGSFSHNYKRLMDKDLYATHPEYFSEIKGKRLNPSKQRQYWKLCLSNPDVVKIGQTKAIQYIKNNPETEYFSLSPNDGGNFCQCQACEKLKDPGNGQSGAVFWYTSQIIKKVQPQFPKVQFPVFSYGPYRYPPKNYVAPKGLLIKITVAGDYGKTITEKGNEEVLKQFESWKKHDVPLWVFGYVYKMAFRQLPWPVFRNTISNIKYYQSQNVKGYIGQISGATWGPNGLQYYMVAKALWNPDLDVEAVFDDYCEKGFGPAKEAIKAYYQTYWTAIKTKKVPLEKIEGKGGWSIYERAIDIYTPDVLEKARGHLKVAFSLAKNKPDILRRLTLLEVSQTYTEKFIPLATANRSYRKGNFTLKKERIRLAKDLLNYLNVMKEKEPYAMVYSMKNNPYSADNLPKRILTMRAFPKIIGDMILN